MNYQNKVFAAMSKNTARGKLFRKLKANPSKQIDVDEKLYKWSTASAYTPKDILLMLEIVENQNIVLAAA